ncbi:MAG: hypothetical protein JWR12_1966 [Mucilaginibacter sp.]|nr:hypothetical protein [Mucilaginibacter sp.]
MKKILLAFCFLLFTFKIFAQQFSQYNTGSLYDAFENPAQRAFIPDTSNMYASNFLVPNINLNFFLSGDAQSTLKARLFQNRYNNSALKINQNKYNLANLNANAYVLMLRTFYSLNGDVEMGISAQMKAEGKSLFSDETLAALNGTQSFNSTTYNNIFNSNYYYQTYNQISFTYREKVTKRLSIGFKFSALLGIAYQKLDITSSKITYDKQKDTAGLNLKGTYTSGFTPGKMSISDYLPNFRNPGASISIGTIYRTEDNLNIQANIKDLGFIHWSSLSNIYNFNSSTNIKGLSTPAREDSIYNKVYNVIRNGDVRGAFITPIDGVAELSINKSYWIDDNKNFKYSPTLIASKELFYSGFVGGLVNPIQYKNYILTLTATYDDLKTFNLGLQAMYKKPNWEVYIGSDKLTQTANMMEYALKKYPASFYQNSSYTGADIFIGFSLKFGPVIEHPMNASTIPTGEKGFLGRLWGRLFKTNN